MDIAYVYRDFREVIDAKYYSLKDGVLKFHSNFEQSLNFISFPDTITQMYLGYRFNDWLHNVKFPQNLTHLYLSTNFNRSLRNVIFPDSIIELHLGVKFNI